MAETQSNQRNRNAYLEAQRQLEIDKQREAERRKINPRRTIIGFILICMFVFACTTTTAVIAYSPCVSQFYDRMPIHPQAELVDDQGDFLTWVGLGDIGQTYYVAQDRDTVKTWYDETIRETRREAYFAERAGEPVPPVWDGTYTVIPNEDGVGSLVQKDSGCYYELRQ